VHNMMRAARLRYFIGIFYSMKQPRRKAWHYSLMNSRGRPLYRPVVFVDD